MKEIIIDGVTYVPKSIQQEEPEGKAVIVRSESSGVFFGYLDEDEDQEEFEAMLAKGIVKLIKARRIWRWAGAATLSQLAVGGTSKPDECKFPCSVPLITILKVIELIPCTEKAIKSITEVPVWEE